MTNKITIDQLPEVQCCGHGPTWIRIDFALLDPDPDLGSNENNKKK